jgi:alpha-D-xyloside xylohydrolase
MVDFTHEGASRFWSARLDPLLALGVRGFKLDYGEDIIAEVAGVRPGFRFSTGDTERGARWGYPQGYHRAYRAALDRAAGGDGFLLVRASSWGGQTVADVVWPGDLDNDFRRHERGQVGGLPAAVHALQSLAVSGFANFGSDTGGYRGGRPSREALLRWAEHTALSPVMQLGGGGEDHNPWSYDPEAVRIYRRLARLHQDLVPYLRVQAVRASRDGTPPVLPLALAFPQDARARQEGDCYLLGTDLLACAVVEPGAATRALHLPPGVWVRWHDGTAATGPAELVEPAPLGQPVLFLRQGAVVPLAASDLATMVPAEEPSVIDGPARRAILRARIVPAGSREVVTEDGARVAVDEATSAPSPSPLRLRFTPGTDAQELRAELLLAHRGSPTDTPVARVTTAEGAALVRAATADEVTAGCAGCWHQDPRTRTLWLSVRGAASVRVEP